MEKKNTKERILDAALELFSVHGYEAVPVADIAAAVGIKASSLYKHYTNKQDIFDSILRDMNRRYAEILEEINQGKEDEYGVELPLLRMEKEELIEFGTNLFFYFLHDEYAVRFRRMLTIEQYKSKEASRLYVEQYVDKPLQYQSNIFESLSWQGKLYTEDATVTALQFYSPIVFVLGLCDNCPEREAEAVELLRRHITVFHKLYREETY